MVSSGRLADQPPTVRCRTLGRRCRAWKPTLRGRSARGCPASPHSRVWWVRTRRTVAVTGSDRWPS